MKQNAFLLLEDGSTFQGKSIGVPGYTVGELVFNTAMTGYQEILTDPSYANQIVTLTYPHIGNTGTNDEDIESSKVYAAGLVIRNAPTIASNWRSKESLDSYLIRHKTVAIADIDTRHLTRHLREKGVQSAVLFTQDVEKKTAEEALQGFAGLKGADIAAKVTTDEIYQWKQGSWYKDKSSSSSTEHKFSVVVYDFGIKYNILRCLFDEQYKLSIVPAQTSVKDVLALKPDGVFLSNGPGDPEPCDYAIKSIQELLEINIPLFGICLGHQLLGLACGANTIKMKFGHHGANHPVLDVRKQKVLITSQNHGFCIDEKSLPSTLEVTHRSLFDDTVQGIAHISKPAFSFQGHPEASPGPHDMQYLFSQFYAMMEQRAKTH